MDKIKALIEWLRAAVVAVECWIRTDGLLHILVSSLLMFALGWVRPLWIAVLIVLAVGVAKEVYDLVSGKGEAEWHDLLCDVIGIILGLFLVWLNLVTR